jgi:GxxExxY protein
MKEKDQLTEQIIGCCFRVHKALGPGFNEKVYHNALKLLFDKEGLKYQSQKEFEVFFLNKSVGSFRADLVVEEEVIVEIKSLAGNIPTLFQNQLVSYLKASGIHTGLLLIHVKLMPHACWCVRHSCESRNPVPLPFSGFPLMRE